MYQYLDLPITDIVNFFLLDFIPSKKKLNEFKFQKNYLLFKDIPSILLEQNELMNKKYKLNLKIKHFLIFYHKKDQPVHIDGGNGTYTNLTLNLPLSGFENTKFNFYKDKKSFSTFSDAFYFNKNDVELIEQIDTNQKWILINTSIPHNVTNINRNNPRLTLCIRYKDNPTFKDIATKCLI